MRWLEAPLRRAIGSPRIGIAVEGFGVPHVHIHKVPVYRGGDLDPHRAKKSAADMLAGVAARIKDEIREEPNRLPETTPASAPH